MPSLYTKLLIAVIVSLSSFSCTAQLFKRSHARENEIPPKLILVELPTVVNKVTYYNKNGKTEKALAIQACNDTLVKRMLADFNDHFSFCPVYFFFDTAVSAIRNREFSSLLNRELKPAQNVVITPADTNYFVAYFGLETPDEIPVGYKNDPFSAAGTASVVPNLIALGPDFKKLRPGLPDKPRMNSVKHTKAPSNLQLYNYMYRSKEFNLSYKPFAYFYSATLTRFYKP